MTDDKMWYNGSINVQHNDYRNNFALESSEDGISDVEEFKGRNSFTYVLTFKDDFQSSIFHSMLV